MWVWFSFRSLLVPAYTSRYLQAPSGVVGGTYRGFDLLHRSLLKRFPFFISFCLRASSVPNFRPDTGGRRWSVVQVAGSVALLGAGVGALPPRLHCSGSRLLSRERALRCPRFQFSGSPQKPGLGCTCVLCLPGPSSSGSQELVRHALPGCGALSPLCGPSLSFHPRRLAACALCLAAPCLAATLPADVNHPESQEVFG